MPTFKSCIDNWLIIMMQEEAADDRDAESDEDGAAARHPGRNVEPDLDPGRMGNTDW